MKISAINVMMDKCKLSGVPIGIANSAQRGVLALMLDK
jgi:hypothetical protein